MHVEEFLELAQLALEAHVGKDDRPSLACKGKRFLERHVFFLHQVGDDTARRA